MAKRAGVIYVRVTPEFEARFVEWSERLGLTKSQFGNMCIQAGFNHVLQAVSPLDALRPGQLRQLLGVDDVERLLKQDD